MPKLIEKAIIKKVYIYIYIYIYVFYLSSINNIYTSLLEAVVLKIIMFMM